MNALHTAKKERFMHSMIVQENRIIKQAEGLNLPHPQLLLPRNQKCGTDWKNSGTLTRKLVLEFLYPSSSVNKALLPSEGRVRVHSDVTYQNMVIHTINVFSLFGTGSGYGVELFTGGYIHEGNWV